MINIKKLEAHGQLLQDRHSRLVKAWCESTDDAYKNKCMRLSIVVDEKLRNLTAAYFKLREEEKEHQRRLDNEPVTLSCRYWGCKFLVIMRREEYTKEEVVICDTCGNEMLTEEEWRIKDMLHSYGIYTQ